MKGPLTYKPWELRCPDPVPSSVDQEVAMPRYDDQTRPIVDSLVPEIERVRADRDFLQRAKRLLDRDRGLLERLAT